MAQKDGWSKEIVVGPVRCNFVEITRNRAEVCKNQKGEEYLKYGMQCLVPTACKPILNKLAAACTEALLARYGDKGSFPRNLKKPILPGKRKDTEKYPFYEGHYYFSTTAYPDKNAPDASPISLIDAHGEVGMGMEPPRDGTFARVKVVAKTYNPEKSQPGVSFRLVAVQPLSLTAAQKMMDDMGVDFTLDDSSLGTSRGPAADGFGSYEDDGASRPEDYQEPEVEADPMDFMGDDDDDDDEIPY